VHRFSFALATPTMLASTRSASSSAWGSGWCWADGGVVAEVRWPNQPKVTEASVAFLDLVAWGDPQLRGPFELL
jgi:hypothetical protein